MYAYILTTLCFGLFTILRMQVALTDDEMNALGAKILKAELMGNEEMAKELKQQLEMARKARASGVKPVVSEPEKVISIAYCF